MTTYLCEHAWLPPGEVAPDVVVEVREGRIARVEPRAPAPEGAVRLRGLVLPGLANAHSHAFHRALRARTHGERGTFWTWRERMYAVASRLDPDTYRDLARAAFAEMVLAGFTAVGEFHYLHHDHGGRRYADPNAMGHALVEAARDAGIRLGLLDACYVAGGIGRDLEGVQRRFGDGDAAAWAARVEALLAAYADAPDVAVGAAVHSVRAVPREQVPTVASWTQARGAPLHVHLSEQPAENDACRAAYGCGPTALLAGAGALGERTTAVHATHLTGEDITLLGASGAAVCLCPTTERDLADGVGPAALLHTAGVRLTLGTDSHALVDPFEEARAVELDLRLATLERGHLSGGTLLEALTVNGQAGIGFGDAGRLAPGARADLVAVDLASVRTAGAPPSADAVVFAAAAPDVTDVVVDGRHVVRGRGHALGDVGALLARAVGRLGLDEGPSRGHSPA